MEQNAPSQGGKNTIPSLSVKDLEAQIPNPNEIEKKEDKLQSLEDDDINNEEDEPKKSFLQKIKGLFIKQEKKKTENEVQTKEIGKLLQQQKDNMKKMQIFLKRMEKQDLSIYESTWGFCESINTSCEKYFYTRDQKDELKKFKMRTTKRYNTEKEVNQEQYKKQKEEERQKNIDSSEHNQSKIKSDNENESQNRNKLNRSLQGNILNAQKSRIGSSHKVIDTDRDEIQKSKGSENEAGKVIQPNTANNNFESIQEDDFGGAAKPFTQPINEENKNQEGEEEDEEEEENEEDNSDEDDDELEEDENGSFYEDEEDDENEEGEEGEEDEGEYDEEQEQENEEKKLKLEEEMKNNREIHRGNAMQIAKLKSSRTLRYSKPLALNEANYYEIQKNKVERIRELDFFKKNIISFKILDKNVDSYLPEILNKFVKNTYNSRLFQRVITSCIVELNAEGEYDPKKQQLIKNLSQEQKNKTFFERIHALLAFYQKESFAVKNQLDVFIKNKEDQQSNKRFYSNSRQNQSSRQIEYEERYQQQRVRSKELEDQFKKYFSRYFFHREEDLFNIVVHLFNKQLLYHTDCLEEINKMDRWILVNQGDLEKIKEGKNKKAAKGKEKIPENVDQMKVILKEVEIYLEMVKSGEQKPIISVSQPPSVNQDSARKKQKSVSEKKN